MEPRPFGTLALNAEENASKWGKLVKHPRTSAFQSSVPAWCLTQRLDVHYHSVAKDVRRVGNPRVILCESVGPPRCSGQGQPLRDATPPPPYRHTLRQRGYGVAPPRDPCSESSGECI